MLTTVLVVANGYEKRKVNSTIRNGSTTLSKEPMLFSVWHHKGKTGKGKGVKDEGNRGSLYAENPHVQIDVGDGRSVMPSSSLQFEH